VLRGAAIVVDWLFGNAYLHVELLQLDDADVDPSTFTLGYTQSLGRKTTMWYEAAVIDSDGIDDPTILQDSTRIMAVPSGFNPHYGCPEIRHHLI